jgi:adenosylcobinamide-phosphate guanylyltransferase
MLALIMAGGAGSRLNLGEKPLILIGGKPMISYVIEAFEKAGCEPVVVTSPKTPMTRNWCGAHGISLQPASGKGYIEDMVESVLALDEKKSLFVSVSDIPCVSESDIRLIRASFEESCQDACSAWVPVSSIQTDINSFPCHEPVDGSEAVPAGINILCGKKILFSQTELKVLIKRPGLAINVNTRSDRTLAEKFLRTIKGNYG